MSLDEQITADGELDVRGDVCPFPWVRTRLALNNLETGQVLRVVGDHGPSLGNVSAELETEGHEILKAEETGEVDWEIVVRKQA